MNAYVYILASVSGTLYVGVTGDLQRRVLEHREGLIEGFTKKYGCKRPVYFEEGESMYGAIEREKQLKKWNRKKKEWLIRTMNPGWKDLYETIY